MFSIVVPILTEARAKNVSRRWADILTRFTVFSTSCESFKTKRPAAKRLFFGIAHTVVFKAFRIKQGNDTAAVA
jgi:hypothetical protein